MKNIVAQFSFYYQRDRTSVKNLGSYMSVFTLFRRVSEFYPVIQV